MRFNRHSDVADKHAILSASKPYWIGDDPEALIERVAKANNAALGTRKHQLAHDLISLGQKLPNTSQTLNMYVNDCIGYRMATEQVLFYSYYAFGTADAIQFRKEADGTPVLRIFDLKTGTSRANKKQLLTYAAFFCLEYGVKPAEISYDVRIYQNDAIEMIEVDGEEIAFIMDQTIQADKLIKRYQEEQGV